MPASSMPRRRLEFVEYTWGAVTTTAVFADLVGAALRARSRRMQTRETLECQQRDAQSRRRPSTTRSKVEIDASAWMYEWKISRSRHPVAVLTAGHSSNRLELMSAGQGPSQRADPEPWLSSSRATRFGSPIGWSNGGVAGGPGGGSTYANV